jgi:hypothetical protein
MLVRSNKVKCRIIFARALVYIAALLAVPAAIAMQAAANQNDIEQLVHRAVALVEKQGTACFPQFRKPHSQWWYGDVYVFIWDLQGNRYVYPPDLEQEKGNYRDLKDIEGKPIGEKFIQIAESPKGQGWVSYRWPEPGTQNPVPKKTFIERARAPAGKLYLVGAGLYIQAQTQE